MGVRGKGINDPLISDKDKQIIIKNRAVSEAIKKSEDLRDKLDLGEYFKGNLFPFQSVGAAFGLAMKRSLLADPVGFGKTVEGLALVARIRKILDEKASDVHSDYVPGPIIIFCPGRSLKQWSDECNKFLGVRPVMLRDSKRTKKDIIASEPDFLLVNYELFVRHPHILDSLPTPELVLLDEASAFKSREAKTSKALKAYNATARIAMAMSATPVETHISDIYSILEVLNVPALPEWDVFKEMFVKTKEYEIERWGKTEKYEKVLGYINLPLALWLIEPYVIRRSLAEIGQQMPQVVIRTEEFEFEDEDHRRKYYEVKAQDYDLPVENHRLPNLHNIQRLSNFFINRRGDLVSPKMNYLIDLLMGDLLQEKIILYAEHKETLDNISKYLTRNKISHAIMSGDVSYEERGIIQEKFNNSPEPRVLVANEVIENSLNLPAARYMFFFDLPYNPKKIEQIIGRMRRITSQHATVIVTFMVMSFSHESDLTDRLNKREALASFLTGDKDSFLLGEVEPDLLLEILK